MQVCRCGVCVYMCYVYVHACARMCVCVRARGWTRPRSLSWPVDLGPAHLARPAPREATPLHGAPGWSSFPGRLGRGLGRVGARPAKDSSGGAQVGPRGKAPRSARPPPNWPPARETASRERETALEAEAGGGGGPCRESRVSHETLAPWPQGGRGSPTSLPSPSFVSAPRAHDGTRRLFRSALGIRSNRAASHVHGEHRWCQAP